jgi:glutamine synthetase
MHLTARRSPGWKGIQASDMLLMPDAANAYLDPFMDETTLNITCDVIEPTDGKGYERDPRSLAKRCEAYLKSTGMGDIAYFGPEPEFFIFDAGRVVGGHVGQLRQDFFERGRPGRRRRSSKAATWGTVPRSRAATFRCRLSIRCRTSVRDLSRARADGRRGRVHHHEWPPQVKTRSAPSSKALVKRADWLQILKYAVHNTAHAYGKTATFMPKPIVGDNGSGMHVHQSIWKDGKNLFAGDGYAGLSELALYYIGGIIKHAKSLNAITNPGTNSYKRLVPDSRRRSTLPTPRAIARRRFAFHTFRTRRAAASKCVSPIPPRILISLFRRC